MVRLVASSTGKGFNQLTGFNSTMVRLVGTLGSNKQAKQESFNSTMVRLVETVIISSHATPLFQFHYGTIGSVAINDNTDQIFFVSIPLWYDW